MLYWKNYIKYLEINIKALIKSHFFSTSPLIPITNSPNNIAQTRQMYIAPLVYCLGAFLTYALGHLWNQLRIPVCNSEVQGVYDS